MSRVRSKNLTPAIRAPHWVNDPAHGYVANTANALKSSDEWAYDNGFEQRWLNAAGDDVVRGGSVDSSNNRFYAEELVLPMRQTIKFNLATAASLVTQHFFVVPSACRLIGMTEIHATAESTAATMTAYIEKLTGTTAPGSGTTEMSGTFDMKATANTLQTGTITTAGTGDSDAPIRQFAAGDRVGIVFSTVGTELAGVVVTLTFAPAGVSGWTTYNMQANGDLVDQTFFLANQDLLVTGISEVHSTLGTNGSAVSLDVKVCTGTQAAASGTTLLSATFDLKAAINTVQTGSLTATTANLRIAPGSRLAVDFTGTLTAVAGVIVVVAYNAFQRRKEVSFALSKNANLGVDQAFFTADRNYEIICVSEVHGVAAGGASKLQLTRDKATDAPGAGTDLIGLNSAAGFDLAATAETVQVCQVGAWPAGAAAVGFVDPRFNFLMSGDRISCDFANAAQSSAGVVVTVSLRAC